MTDLAKLSTAFHEVKQQLLKEMQTTNIGIRLKITEITKMQEVYKQKVDESLKKLESVIDQSAGMKVLHFETCKCESLDDAIYDLYKFEFPQDVTDNYREFIAGVTEWTEHEKKYQVGNSMYVLYNKRDPLFNRYKYYFQIIIMVKN
jgi:hypothetical protein